jgi:ferrochelatase
MARRRVAVVLFNLGGPDSPKAVRPFLFNLFRDPAIIGLPGPARLAIAALISLTRTRTARANYALMGGSSPLLRETEDQADALRKAMVETLADADAEVFVAMRYWKPLVADAAAAVARFAPDEVVLLPLYPQFSSTTTASSLAEWRRTYKGPGRLRTLCCYPDDPGLVKAHVRKIEDAWAAAGRPENLRLLFSAHGLPEKVVAAGDPYQWQVERTCAAVAARLGPEFADWKICYQSRVGPLKWLGPSTPEAIEEAAHQGHGVIITPIAFVSEHVETLVELDHEYAHVAEHSGCPAYVRAPAITLEPHFIEGLTRLVGEALTGSPRTESGCGGRICPAEFGKCPAQLSTPIQETAA